MIGIFARDFFDIFKISFAFCPKKIFFFGNSVDYIGIFHRFSALKNWAKLP